MKGKWYWRYTHFPRVTMIVGGRVLPGACWSCFQFWNVECKHLFRYFEIEFDWTAKKSKLRGRSCMKLKHHNNVACVCVCVCLPILFCFVFCFVDLLVCLLDDLFGSLGFFALVTLVVLRHVCFLGFGGAELFQASYGKMEQDGPPEAGFGRKVRGLQWISRWWFQMFFMFTPIWGRFPIGLIFFRWVETTNHIFLPPRN